jgi:hypothetical protein
MRGHVATILTNPQGVMDGVLYESRVREKVGAPASGNSDIGCRGLTVLARPRIQVVEENFVRVEYVLICDRLCDRLRVLQILDGKFEVPEKSTVFKPLDLSEVFEPFRISEIASCFEVTKNIECHGLRCLI